MNDKKNAKKLQTRYTNSVVYYKNLSCRASLYEDRIITEYCQNNNISKSMLLIASAMYCASNNVSVSDMLEYTANNKDFDYRKYMEDENKDE